MYLQHTLRSSATGIAIMPLESLHAAKRRGRLSGRGSTSGAACYEEPPSISDKDKGDLTVT